MALRTKMPPNHPAVRAARLLGGRRNKILPVPTRDSPPRAAKTSAMASMTPHLPHIADRPDLTPPPVLLLGGGGGVLSSIGISAEPVLPYFSMVTTMSTTGEDSYDGKDDANDGSTSSKSGFTFRYSRDGGNDVNNGNDGNDDLSEGGGRPSYGRRGKYVYVSSESRPLPGW
jgi:hypothetical protein